MEKNDLGTRSQTQKNCYFQLFGKLFILWSRFFIRYSCIFFLFTAIVSNSQANPIVDSSGKGGNVISPMSLVLFQSNVDDLYVDCVTLPDSSLTIIGMGKGENGGSVESQGAGLDYCQLGTGKDVDSNITGERSIFGPNLNIHFGAHYTNLTSDRWCGRGWYRPDGSVYDENIYEYHIPDPADSGYDSWSWYNVVFDYNPMPSGMQREEGNWTAIWWDEGASTCSKVYTVMYDLDDHTMCNDVESDSPFDPINIDYTFSSSDDKCYSWISLNNFAVNQTNDVKWMWYRPDGNLYAENEQDISNPGEGSWWDWYKIWSWIDIDGTPAASYPGVWHVDVYIKDYQGSYKLKYTEYFTIEETSQPDLIVEDIDLSPITITEGGVLQRTVLVRNAGSASSGACHLRIQTSGDLSATEIVAIPSLSPSQPYSYQDQILTGSLSVGNYTVNVLAEVDCNDEVVESNETNNSRQEIFNIIVQPEPQPDIDIQPIQLIFDCNNFVNTKMQQMSSETQSYHIPQQSTSGPVPPPGVTAQSTESQERAGGGASGTLSVPAYAWRHGCGPTALGMVIGYYDGLDYPDLIPGDAVTQTSDVDQVIASQGSTQNPKHYEDYSLPDDDGESSVFPDKSELPTGDEHIHDCIADYMKTSWSSEGNFYGWSWSDHMGPAFIDYVNLVNPNYGPSYQFYDENDMIWDILTQEIDAQRPMVFLVDTDANNGTDHYVTVVGYRDDPVRQYGCLDTWDPYDTIRWCDFETIQTGQPWGIWGGWSFSLTPPQADNTFTIFNTGNAALTVSSIVPETVAPWLDWNPKPPYILQPGEDVDITVTVDCLLAPCTDTTRWLLIYSDDPDENPYPAGIDITVQKPELTGDLSRDCVVETADLILFVQDWLYQGCDTEADLFVDCKIDLKDFVVLSEYWLTSLE